MRIAIDIETNSLDHPDHIWVVATRNLDTGELNVFREPTEYPDVGQQCRDFLHRGSLFVGHNWLEFDYPCLHSLLGLSIDQVERKSIDTLVLSRLVNYTNPRGPAPGTKGAGSGNSGEDVEGLDETRLLKGHSIEAYGVEFGYPKLKFSDFSKYSKEMEDYCVRDVDICIGIYNKYRSCIDDPAWRPSIELEHRFQTVINELHNNGFAFNTKKATALLQKVTEELEVLDKGITDAFPPKLEAVREIHPKLTQHGTLHKGDFRWVKGGDLSEFNGGPFTRCEWRTFNPSSHRQIVTHLAESRWLPSDKTTTHIETEREINRLKFNNKRSEELDLRLKALYIKLEQLQKTGWKVNENNLSTLPSTAPPSSRLLAKRILLESRRRTLTEWLGLVSEEDGRIHGKFYSIGAWTHRMAHQKPNTANIPNEFDLQDKKKLLGKEMRALWQAPKNRLLVGVDAEGIQLRVFAHLINELEFTDALVNGDKQKKTDPHSLNQRVLGPVCKSRAAAKRFIFALLLGAGMWKLSQILECSEAECQEALNRLIQRYQGWGKLKREDIPRDAKNGYFIGLDGRKVRIPGNSISEKKHLAMSGYLQNGEVVIMKLATLKWMEQINGGHKSILGDEVQSAGVGLSFCQDAPSIIPGYEAQVPSRERGQVRNSSSDPALVLQPSHFALRPRYQAPKIVNLVHDEWQTETSNNMEQALWVAECQSRALREVGEELKLNCPLAGSYWNDSRKDYTIGTNWSVTH